MDIIKLKSLKNQSNNLEEVDKVKNLKLFIIQLSISKRHLLTICLFFVDFMILLYLS